MTRRDGALLVLLGAIWGAVFPLSSAVLEQLPPLAVVVARTGLSAAVLVPLALRQGIVIRELRRRSRALLIASLLQLTLPIMLLTLGQRYVSAGLAAILLGTQPVWAAVFSAAFSRRLPGGVLLGVAAGLAGVILLFVKDLGGSSSTPVWGILLVLSAAGYAAGAIYIQRALSDVPPLTVAATAMTLTSGLLLAPTFLLVRVQTPDIATLAWLATLGTIATGGALVLFYQLIGLVGAVRANLAAYLAPGFAVLYDLPLGHVPSLTSLLGLALVIAGSATAARAPLVGSSVATET